jgi:ABC-type nitrate/sulfonate/bicarbonate transport system permease component
MEWINPVLFSAPSNTIIEMVALYNKGLPIRSELVSHTLATLQRLGIGYISGVCLGILMGISMGISNGIFHFFNPLISVLMPIPGIALAPLFIIWFGFGNPTVIILGALSTFFPVVYSTSTGIRSVNRQLVRAAKIMGANPLQVIINVHIPWAAAYIFSGMKIGLARGWMTIIAVEFVAASNYGLGYMIWRATEFLQSKIVYGGILIMVLIFIVLDKGIIQILEKHTISKWGLISRK